MFWTIASILDLKCLWSLPSFGSTFLSFQTTTQAKLLLRIIHFRSPSPSNSRLLFGQVSTCTGHYKLPIFHCTNVHPRRYARPLFRPAVYRWRHETQYAHNKILDGPEKKKIQNRLSRLKKCNRLGAMNKMSYHEMSLEFVRIVGPKGLLEETRLVTRKKLKLSTMGARKQNL